MSESDHFAARFLSLFERVLPDPAKASVLARLAAAQLERGLADYHAEGASTGGAVLDVLREVTFDNLTAADWARSPLALTASLADRLDDLPPLPDSAFPAEGQTPPPGLARYLASVLPAELLVLLEVCLTLGCRPDEADRTLALPEGTAARLLARALQRLGATGPRVGALGRLLAAPTKSEVPAAAPATEKSATATGAPVAAGAPAAAGASSAAAPSSAAAAPSPTRRNSGPARVIRLAEATAPRRSLSSLLLGATPLFVASVALTLALLYGVDALRSALTFETARAGLGSERPEAVARVPSQGRDLTAGQVLRATNQAPLAVDLSSGARVVLRPGSEARFHGSAVEVVAGAAGVDVPAGLEAAIALRCGLFRATLEPGRYVLITARDEATLAAYAGEASLTLAAAPADYPVEAGRQARVDAAGHVLVTDIPGEPPVWLASLEAARGAAAEPSGASEPRRPAGGPPADPAPRNAPRDDPTGGSTGSAGPAAPYARPLAVSPARPIVQGRGAEFYRHLF